ncbi:putative Epididymal secretory protein E1 [Hypsibius exemplaris]|uniref:Epididymal secretory protein E1 n=1 Tax=Hypsibius exemplaris TaxID=2072580 RepID=A0A1W0WU74_HYPEX|nr:putative Epididymal secretory protein E1 [Hypsibius exemplaris]
MLLKVLLFAFVFGCATALTAPCNVCKTGSPSGTCKTVTIDPCTAQPCGLKQGTNVTFAVEFTAGAAATALTSTVYGIIAGTPIKFNLPNPNGCKDSGIACPLVAGQTYTYTDQLYVSELYPSINLVVQWSLLDQASNPIFCILAPAKIVSK